LDIKIFEEQPDLMLLYNIYKPGDGTGVGYVGIKDAKNKYEIDTKVFYKEMLLIDCPELLEGIRCGIISSHYVHLNFEKVYNSIGKTIKSETDNSKLPDDYDYEKLPKKLKAIFQAYLQIRIIETERKSGISPLEIFLLDTIEMNKRRYKQRFDLERNIKDLCKWYGFKIEKLKSGLQRRRSCRRWAKQDFENNDGKFVSDYQYTHSKN
jgi:hypothetical protein